jgi:predicted transposase/invertase (TIGR01784 family)
MFPQVPNLHLDFRMRSEDPPLKLGDSLQLHLLELPKYTAPSDNGSITDPIEQWAYFFQEAAHSTRHQLTDRLRDEAFAEAAGVLEMIAKSPEERELYEARLKLQRDEQSRIDAAEERGEARGVALGEIRGAAEGRVRLLQEWLGHPPTELDELTLEELAAMERELQRQMRNRG